MWTLIKLAYTTPDTRNCWAFAVATNKWHKVAATSSDGVSNVFLILTTAQATGKSAYLALDSAGAITAAYF